MRRIRLSMRTWLLLGFAALLLPLLIFSAWSYQRSRESERSDAVLDALHEAQTAASVVHGVLRELESGALILGQAYGNQVQPLDQDSAAPGLVTLSERYPFVRAVFLMDPAGRVIATPTGQNLGLDLSRRPYTQALLAGQDAVLSDAVPGTQTGEPILTFARTVRAPDGAVRGFLAVAFYPDRLAEALPGALPRDADLSVFDRRGFHVYSSTANSQTAEQRERAGDPRIAAALAGQVSSTDASGEQQAGTQRIAAYVPVPDYGWVVSVSRPVAAVEGDLQGIFRRQLLALIALGLGAVVLAVLLSRQLSRPLVRLAAHARAFGQGERTPMPAISGPAEVETLAGAIATMEAEIDARFAERAAAEERLRAAEERYRGIFENALEGIFQTGFDGRFQAVNPAGARLMGYDTPAELIAAVPDVRQVYADPERLQDYLEEMQRQGEVTNFEFRVRLRDGSLCWLSLNARAIRSPDGRIAHVEGMVSDITERKQVEEERERLLAREAAAREEAEAANRAKDEFLSVLSHELRTPLTPILGFTQMLRRHRPTDAASLDRAVDAIENSARAQSRLVADLLDVSGIIAGKLELALVAVDLRPIVEAAVTAARPSAEAKGIALAAELGADNGTAIADPDRIQQVVANLLTNAMKFTPSGGAVTVRLTREDETAVITVADTGIGIAPAFLPHVFERFRQADASSTRAHGGLGLGLSIVQDLVRMHGGTVSAASDGPDRGATFTVRLPLAVPRDHAVRPPDSVLAGDGNGAALAGLRILVVEDDDDTRTFLQMALESAGAIVTLCASSPEALSTLDTAHPDALLADIGMPNEDGYAFIRAVRERTAGAGGRTPAIAVTAYATLADRQQALAAGFDAHLSKPVDQAALVLAVRQLLTAAREGSPAT